MNSSFYDDAARASGHEVRFVWNGIKVDGELIKTIYWKNNDGSYCISTDRVLPRFLFMNVRNETDIMTDYFDDDSAIIDDENPLYRYVEYAYLKKEQHETKRAIADFESRNERRWHRDLTKDITYTGYKKELSDCTRKLSGMKDPGKVSEDDLAAIDSMKDAAKAEKQRIREQEREELRKKVEYECKYGEILVSDTQELYPVQAGKPVILVDWSESNYLTTAEGNLFSVAGINSLLTTLDNIRGPHNGYDKTGFKIYMNATDFYDEAEPVYEGRYDIGDGDHGITNHILSYANFYREKGFYGTGATAESIEKAEQIEKLARSLA